MERLSNVIASCSTLDRILGLEGTIWPFPGQSRWRQGTDSYLVLIACSPPWRWGKPLPATGLRGICQSRTGPSRCRPAAADGLPMESPWNAGPLPPIPHPSHRQRTLPAPAFQVHTPCPSGGKLLRPFPQAWIPLGGILTRPGPQQQQQHTRPCENLLRSLIRRKAR